MEAAPTKQTPMAEGELKPGDKVRTVYGEIRTVLYVAPCQVFVAEECNRWYHPSKVWKIR